MGFTSGQNMPSTGKKTPPHFCLAFSLKNKLIMSLSRGREIGATLIRTVNIPRVCRAQVQCCEIHSFSNTEHPACDWMVNDWILATSHSASYTGWATACSSCWSHSAWQAGKEYLKQCLPWQASSFSPPRLEQLPCQLSTMLINPSRRPRFSWPNGVVKPMLFPTAT